MCTESLSANVFCKNQRRSLPISDLRDRLKNALFLATPISCWSLKIPADRSVVLVNVQATLVRSTCDEIEGRASCNPTSR